MLYILDLILLEMENRMKNVMIVSCIIVILALSAKSVLGYVQFYAAFKKVYVDKNSPEEFKTLIKNTKCSICHDPTKKKENGTTDKKFRNPYGAELDALLSKEDKKDKEKIYTALETISSQKASGADKTYGERIKEYQLPYPIVEEIKYGSSYYQFIGSPLLNYAQ